MGEDRELRLQWERRWLLEDPLYMASRTQWLLHHTVQARMNANELTSEGGESAGRALPRISTTRPKKHHQAAAPSQQQGSSARRTERNESAACVKSLKVLQKELRDSAHRVE